ncbi:MAG: hypothetical protein JXB38_09865 [Anaerolineales bacterium]|nr:hypothetical protein [Anaerolineales bacterium]
MSSHERRPLTDQEFDASLKRVMRNWSKDKVPPTNVRHKILMAAAIERSRKPSPLKVFLDWLADMVLSDQSVYVAQDKLYAYLPHYIVPVFQAEFAIFRQVF